MTRPDRTPRRRQPRLRPVKTTILIVCEGRQTERNYLDQIKREDAVRLGFDIKVRKGSGSTPERVVDEAIKYKRQDENHGKNYDEIWCVLDVEDASKLVSVLAAEKKADEHDLKLFWSNPCFEIWLLAHFVRQARPYENSEKVERELSKKWEEHWGTKYAKNDDQIYNRLEDRRKGAIDNARLVLENDHQGKSTYDANSSTDVYKLVERLFGASS